MEDFEIDPEFRDLLPPASGSSYELLLSRIASAQRADPGVVVNVEGKRFLLDGHTRRRICAELKIPFLFSEISLPDRHACLQWIVDNQIARRNLTDEQRAYFIGKRYLDAGSKRDWQGDLTACQKTRAREEIAAGAGVSTRTVSRAADFAQAVEQIRKEDPELAQKILDGESGLSREDVIRRGDLCDRCRRVGAVKDCQFCAHLRKAPAKQQRVEGLFNWTALEQDLNGLANAPQLILEAFPSSQTEPLWNSLHRQIETIGTTFRSLKKALEGG